MLGKPVACWIGNAPIIAKARLALDHQTLSLTAEDRAAECIVRRATASEKAGKRYNFVDDGQVGVKMRVLLKELRQFAASARQFAFHSAKSQMRVKAALLFAIAELRFESVFDLRLQSLQLFGAVLNSDPQDFWIAKARKRARAAARNLKRLKTRGYFVHDAANVGCFRVWHIAQEFECQMHLLWTDPVDLCGGYSQLIDQVAGATFDARRDFDGNEGADARHGGLYSARQPFIRPAATAVAVAAYKQ